MVRVLKSFFQRRKGFDKAGQYLWHIGKWGVVIWLLLPIRKSLGGPVDFSRIVFGILLFILFGGKVFYDSVLDNITNRPEKKPVVEVMTLLATTVVIALVVGVTIVFVGYLLFAGAQQAAESGK